MHNMKEGHVRAIGTDKLIFLLVGGLTVVILAIAAVVIGRGGSTASAPVTSYKTTDAEKPKAVAETIFSDLGKIKVKDEKQADFTITNAGTKPLELSNISSSCGCTVGKVTINGETSPEFGMHSKGSWVGTVPPGSAASVAVIYRPYVMPVVGVVTRDVYVRTNDPEKPEITLTVKADVE